MATLGYPPNLLWLGVVGERASIRMGRVPGGDGQGLGSLRVSSGFFGCGFQKQVGPNSGYLNIMLIGYIEPKGDRVEGV